MSNVFDLGNRRFRTDDVFSNNRAAVVIDSSVDVRRSAYRLGEALFSSGISGKMLRSKENVVLEILDDKDNYPPHDSAPYYDCRDWAFDKVELPHYTFRDGKHIADGLRDEDFSDIFWIPRPEKDAVAMYFDRYYVTHWGVVDDISEGVHVASKWGNSHVYRHLLCNVPIEHGDYVSFFRVGSA